MKIALLGYGKMGKEIEQVALALHHEVVLKIDENNIHELTPANLKKADVAIEFTTPHSAVNNILMCFEASVPVVSGTTGWLGEGEQAPFTVIKKICMETQQAFFYASNFSIGVNLFFKLNEYLAGMMKAHPEYFPAMEEIHHIHKKDAPSGTAITLAEGLIKTYSGIDKWESINSPADSADFRKLNPRLSAKSAGNDKLPIYSKREGEVPGTHTVFYTSKVDEIKISHEAFSRKGFAEGAVHAAAWLIGKKGVFGMKEMLSDER